MILGVGIDTVDVERIAGELSKETGLKERLFTPAEIAYCEERRHAARHFAARFAAKEALFKALGTGLTEGMAFREIEVSNDARGRPELTLHAGVRRSADTRGVERIHVSLTHTADAAAAVVVLEAGGEKGQREGG